MSALDRLQNFSSKSNTMSSDVFNVSTPEGCFLEKLHRQGYLMYEYYYENSEGEVLSERKFNWLSEEKKQGYEKKFRYTELHDMLTTDGDQLVLANAGSGKALTNDTNILVLDYGTVIKKCIGDINVGDLVLGTDFKAHKVTGVYPQGKLLVNNVTISNGSRNFVVSCCSEHLWTTVDNEVITTGTVKRRIESGMTVPLVALTPGDINLTNGFYLSDLDKAVIALNFFKLFDYKRLKNTDPVISVSSDMYRLEKDFIRQLITLLDTPLLSITASCGGSNIVLKLSNELLSLLKLKGLYNDKYLNNLLNFLKPLFSFNNVLLDVLRNGCLCYKIVDVNETLGEVEMTCIEVSSDNHLFLLENYIPTHNTTALIFKIMHDIITGEATKIASIPNGNQVRVVDDIFVGTFLKTGADELSERLSYWQRGMGYTVTADRVNFSTLHAEFKRALNTMGASTPIGKPSEITKCMKKAIDNLGISRDGSALTSEDYNVIGGIITYYRGRLDNKRYSHPSAYDYGLTPTLLDRLVSDFARHRQLAGIMDFEDLQELLYKFLYVTPNKAVQDFCANRYKYIYLDEFQDTSQIQYAIIKFYARGRLWMNRSNLGGFEDELLYTGNESLGKIVVVGDPDQCIYEWRGSDNKIIEEDFESDFKPCHTSLSYNYRCPSNILNAIVPSIKVNRGHETREYKSSRDGGICRGYCFNTYKSMLSQLFVDIDEDMQEGNTVAILCRTNFDGVIPAFILESSGHYDFSISSQNMTFDSPLPRKLVAVTSLFTERSSMAVKNTLSMFVPRYAEWSVKQLVDTLKTNNKSIWQIPEADIAYSCPELAPVVKEIKSLFYENGKRCRNKEMDALKYVYNWIRVNSFGGASLYCENARAYIDSLVYLIDNNKFESVFEFLDFVNTLNERLHARINNPKAKISIATVHEFKGKERDSIIVWNDTDGVFPSSKTDIENVDELEGERRVHYVACTRAKKKSTIYTIYGKSSIFVDEMDLEFESPQQLGGTLKSSDLGSSLTEDEENLLNLMQDID